MIYYFLATVLFVLILIGAYHFIALRVFYQINPEVHKKQGFWKWLFMGCKI